MDAAEATGAVERGHLVRRIHRGWGDNVRPLLGSKTIRSRLRLGDEHMLPMMLQMVEVLGPCLEQDEYMGSLRNGCLYFLWLLQTVRGGSMGPVSPRGC